MRPVVLAGLLAAGICGTASAETFSLAELTSGGTFTIGQVEFFAWGVDDDTSVDTLLITIDTIDNESLPGFQVNGNDQLEFDDTELEFTFSVRTLDDQPLINGALVNLTDFDASIEGEIHLEMVEDGVGGLEIEVFVNDKSNDPAGETRPLDAAALESSVGYLKFWSELKLDTQDEANVELNTYTTQIILSPDLDGGDGKPPPPPDPVGDVDGDGVLNDEDKDNDNDNISDKKDVDKDGDGWDVAIENAHGTDDLDPESLPPLGEAGDVGPGTKKVTVKLNRKTPDKDSIVVNGTMPVAEDFDPAGSMVSFEFDEGAFVRDYTLDDKGKFKDKEIGENVSFSKPKRLKASDTYVTNFKFKAKKQDLADVFPQFSNAELKDVSVPLQVAVTLDGATSINRKAMSYTAKPDKNATAKQPKPPKD